MSVLALTGGVGGAKLACGLHRILPEQQLTCLVNTADDFDHLGLRISPDLDSVMYAMSGEHNRQTGWGRRDETWQFMDALKQYDADGWFALGDRDLATHVLRTEALKNGLTLTEITARLGRSLGIQSRLLPMTDQSVHTRLETEEGELDFQSYFVKKYCQPVIKKIHFAGAKTAMPNPAVLQLLKQPLDCIVLCPSNPYLSLAPMLALPGLAEALRANGAPIVAVSPIIGCQAVKGPAAKIMHEMGATPGATGVAQYYTSQYPGLLSGFVIDRRDADESDVIKALQLDVVVLATLMTNTEEQDAFAKALMEHYGVGCRSR